MSRRILALTALCAGLAVLRFGVPTRDDAGQTLRWRLAPFEDWQRVRVERTGWAPTTLERTAEGWRVGGTPVDGHALRALEAALGPKLRIDQRSQAASEAEQARFGLGPHSVTVTLESAAGVQILRLGKIVDGQSSFFTASDGPPGEVLRASVNLRQLFERPPHTWADRRLFPQRSYAEVARLSRHDGSRPTWSLAREAPDRPWRLVVPPTAEVGQAEASNLVQGLVSLEVERLDPTAEDPPPRFTLEAETFRGERFGLRVAPRDGGLQVQPLGGGPVGHLARWQTGFIDVPLAALQERRLLDIEPDEIRAVVASGAVPLHLARGPEGWRITLPHPVPADPDRALAYVQGIAQLRASGFGPPPPEGSFTPPHQRLQIKLTGDRVVTLEIGAPFGQGRYLRSSQRSTGGFVINAAIVEALSPRPEDLQADEISPPPGP